MIATPFLSSVNKIYGLNGLHSERVIQSVLNLGQMSAMVAENN
jgi:hypothetical protein